MDKLALGSLAGLLALLALFILMAFFAAIFTAP